MSLINSQIKPFKAQAFKGGKFIEVTEESLKDIWSVFFFYPADFTFVCPTELEDLADITRNSRSSASRFSPSRPTRISPQGLARHLAGDRQDRIHHGRRPDRMRSRAISTC